MSLIKVYIATTDGPVAIQRITEEDPDVNSVICLSGKAIALSVSHAYDTFVRNPTGVVQRYFGHAAYRLDVSRKIDEGYSWQFAVFTAHALKYSEYLAEMDASAKTIVIATGELDRDLLLVPVDGISEKIRSLQINLPELIKEAGTIIIAVPQGTDEIWREAFSEIKLPRNQKIEIIAAKTANDLLSRLGLDVLNQKSALVQAAPLHTLKKELRQSSFGLTSISLLIVVVALTIFYGRDIMSWIDILKMHLDESFQPNYVLNSHKELNAKTFSADKPVPYKNKTKIVDNVTPKISMQERRAPVGETCSDVNAGRVSAIDMPYSPYSSDRLNLAHHNLCTIKLMAETENSRLWMYGRYQHWTGTKPDRSSPDEVIERGPTNQNLSWSINISNKMRNGTVFQLIVISAPNEFLPPHKIINRLGRVKAGSEQLRILLDQLQQLGLRVTFSQFRIIK